MGIIVFLFIAGAYLLGSISSAVLTCRLFGIADPRHHGSGNPGATNVYRLGGRFPAIIVLIFDMLKGVIPVWGAYFAGLPPVILGAVAISACFGHMFPVFFHFEGGKGVATAFGSVLPIGLDLGGLLIATWIVVLLVTGYSSAAALITALLAPLFTWLIKPEYTLPVSMLACLIILRHHSNITRLWNQTESKILRRRNSRNK
ncbi:glycerol-3-phosphate 1-O-acyltransferase PlsY [Celerinatantimonas sp. YJH-8]|uniref:glycerol-3-phosphate 1-O-acyltransferase PlsY n=1 Tax=Celerinatantimonas sp. YJH-8 TaxID=3228714 RepID=UPI0038CB975F